MCDVSDFESEIKQMVNKYPFPCMRGAFMHSIPALLSWGDHSQRKLLLFMILCCFDEFGTFDGD